MSESTEATAPAEIVVDTSAAFAVICAEPGSDALLELLDTAELRLMSAATLVELAIVLEHRLGQPATGIAQRFVMDGAIDVIPFDQDQANQALAGWRRFGKGRHPAALNLGDCFTYALAASRDLPVLCVGTDFPATDLEVLPVRARGADGASATPA